MKMIQQVVCCRVIYLVGMLIDQEKNLRHLSKIQNIGAIVIGSLSGVRSRHHKLWGWKEQGLIKAFYADKQNVRFVQVLCHIWEICVEWTILRTRFMISSILPTNTLELSIFYGQVVISVSGHWLIYSIELKYSKMWLFIIPTYST